MTSFEYYGRFAAVFITKKPTAVTQKICPIWMSCWRPAVTPGISDNEEEVAGQENADSLGLDLTKRTFS